MEPSAAWLTSSVSSPAFSSTGYSDVISKGRKSGPRAWAKQAMPSSWIHSCQMLLLSWWIVESDDDGDGEASEEGITWRRLVSVLLTLLLDMERSLDGLSSYRKAKTNYYHYHVSHSFSFTIRLCLILQTLAQLIRLRIRERAKLRMLCSARCWSHCWGRRRFLPPPPKKSSVKILVKKFKWMMRTIHRPLKCFTSVKRLDTKLIPTKPRKETAGKQTWMYTM